MEAGEKEISVGDAGGARGIGTSLGDGGAKKAMEVDLRKEDLVVSKTEKRSGTISHSVQEKKKFDFASIVTVQAGTLWHVETRTHSGGLTDPTPTQGQGSLPLCNGKPAFVTLVVRLVLTM